VGSRVCVQALETSDVSEPLDRLANMLRNQEPHRVALLFDEVLMPRKRREPEPIGDALRDAIRKEGYTAYRLSKMTGSSIDSIQRWLSGERQGLTLKTVERLAVALDLVLVPREPAEGKRS
jgi:hypothetical protein